MKTRLFGLSVWALLVVALAGFTPVLAYADDTGTSWIIDYNIGSDNLQLILTLGTEVGNSGYYNVTGLSGTDFGNGNASLTLDGATIPHGDVANPTPTTFGSTDNLFNPTVAANPFTNQTATPTLFDAGGLAYFESGEQGGYALYYNAIADEYEGDWVIPASPEPINDEHIVTIDSVTETPEPPPY